ncbi:N-formylglutamate amidohydrolase [Roseiarcaceae bacterium H3SJ34-1]|nr:N-formylglutamate amidohydrolase [Roseiarcaceae bacterium H3SJ34-1]
MNPSGAAGPPDCDNFKPVELLAGKPDAPALFLCDHASNALPKAYGSLGLPPEQFARHIAWDIGAADVTRALAAMFEAPAILSRFSRLLIDPNRGADDPTLVMRISDGALIPANAHIDDQEIARRTDLYWRPYREAVASELDRMTAHGTPPAIVSIHSFTPIWRGTPRPWQIGLLWDGDARLAQALMSELEAQPDLTIGDNEPYDGALEGDTLYDLGTLRGIPHILVEVRQDLIATQAGAQAWAGRIALALRPALARADVRMIERHPSHARSQGGRPALTRTRA